MKSATNTVTRAELYQKAYRYLMPKLEDALPAKLQYHNAAHTKSVIAATEQIATAEGVTGEGFFLLKTASLFHDAGFLKAYKDHEEASCQIASEALPGCGFSVPQIEVVCQIIMATKLPQNPSDILQQIICDADLHYLGTASYFSGAESLYQELKATGQEISRKDWSKLQVQFLTSHKFFTRFANAAYADQKAIHLKTVVESNSACQINNAG